MEMLKRIMKASFMVLLVFGILTLILAALICFTPFNEKWTYGGLIAALSISTVLSGVLFGKLVGKKGILVGFAASVLFMLFILFIVNMVFSGRFGIDTLTVYCLIPVMTGIVGGIVGVGSK